MDSQYRRLKETLKYLHHRRLQVEYLTIRMCTDYTFDKRTLLNMFPNLRKIVLLPIVHSHPEQKYMDSPFQFDNKASKLEKIKDFGECELIPYAFPRDIKPALLVTKLKLYMECYEEFDTHIQLYNYMSRKYPSISTLILDDEAIDEEGPENLQTLFERGLFPFFQSIQPQTVTFCLANYYDEMNLFKKFDEFAWKLKELKLKPPFDDHHFFGEIAQSKQSKYIQKLTLIDSVCSPINLLSNMQVLTSLHLEGHHAYKSTDNNVNLNELIEYSPPTLTHLTLSNINLLCNESTLKYSSITHLDIQYIMSPLLTKRLATHFPKLSVFKYHGSVNGKYTIALPNHDLEEFNVTITYPEGLTTELSIETTCGDMVEYGALKKIATRLIDSSM